MIDIYTSYEKIDRNAAILDPEAYFNGFITSSDFDELDNEAMHKIDGAELLDKDTGTVKTPRGITSIDSLSTGCKTAITYLHMLRHLDGGYDSIDVSGCGYNALDYIFDIASKSEKRIKLILRHRDDVFRCKRHRYEIDGEREIDDLLYM